MSTTTVRTPDTSHWYYTDGRPCYELPKKSGPGMKTPTIADARVLGLVPSVTTILRIINKPSLQDWIISQAVMAVLTSPRLPGEDLDAFAKRILQVERVQDQESRQAMDRGTEIHKAIELAVQACDFDLKWKDHVAAVFGVLGSLGKVVWSEKVLVGDGYAGRADILMESDRELILLDFKTTKKVPTSSYDDHKMQTAAYAKPIGNTGDKRIITGNLYISTSNSGEVNLCLQDDWQDAYEYGFRHAFELWKYMNHFDPCAKL